MGEIVTSISGDVASVIISNNAKLNAIDVSMWQQLKNVFQNFGNNKVLRCIIVEGAGGKAFSAGADISEFPTTRTTRDQVTRYHEDYVGPALMAIAECDVPVLAKIRGVCMGGGLEIALMADLRFADGSARFAISVGKLGFPLAFGETQKLYRLVGSAVAAELLIEGHTLNAAEAQSRGLITRVSIGNGLDSDVALSVDGICSSGLWAARSHKRQLRRLMHDSSPVTLQERLQFYAFAETNEYRDSLHAFLQKKVKR